MSDVVSVFLANTLSKHQSGLIKSFIIHHCSIRMRKTVKGSVDDDGFLDLLMTNFSKAFDFLSHQLFIA